MTILTQIPSPAVAVVGCGYWGRNLVREFHGLGALAAVCDASAELVGAMAERYQVPARPFHDVLADPAIIGVALATPARTHAQLAIRALEAGKHVFVEKPLALSIADAKKVRDSALANGRQVMVGHLLRYHPAFLKLQEIIAAGRLGRLRYLYSNRLNLGKFRREEDVFWSFAPHDISMILALAGDAPESVEAVGHSYLYNNIADVTTTHLRFANGINAHIFVSWLHPCKEQRLVIVGESGMAVFDDTQPWARKLVLYPHHIAWTAGEPLPSRGEEDPVPLEEAQPLRLECGHFLDCLRDGRKPRTDAEEGIRVLRVLDAATRSMVSARPGVRREAAEPAYFAHESVVIDPGCEIGAGTKIWHFSHLLGGSKVGRDCVIGQNAAIGPDVTIGNGCKIQNNVSVYKGVVLGDGVFCGPSCVFTNVNTPRAEVDRRDAFRPTFVGRGATIGANATIVCGHRLGDYCFIAAGAVVTKDVPPHALMVGNPARQIGWVSHAGERLGADFTCPRSGTRYEIDARGQLTEAALEKIA